MGYDMSLCLTVQPASKYDEVRGDIEVMYGTNFDGDDGTGVGYLSDGTTRWSSMTEEMQELSKKHPEAIISIRVEGEENAEWIEWYSNGKHYEEGRPDWTPNPFDPNRLA